MPDASPPATSVRATLRLAAWGLAAALTAIGLIRGDFLLAIAAAGAIAMGALGPLYTWISGIRLPKGLATGILVFCLACFVAGEWGGLYEVGPEASLSHVWDKGLHAIASAVLAVTGWALVLLLTAGGPPRMPLWIGSVLAVGLAALVGAGWELFEFTVDALFGTNAQRSGLPDTMGDVAANLAGATWGAVAVQIHLRTGARLPFAALLSEACAANPLIFPEWTGAPFAADAARAPLSALSAHPEETTAK
ncbi:hypothetical protein [Tropicimonas sp. IMCC34011]|uniref:hypothetical protein n=1 Tax=Tropicimonas sp. IMCC34011 TaxID=2248759 RepID=UPI0018E58F28|nr:hypothetical protein [Tropicimonas sp. IMCC34011]